MKEHSIIRRIFIHCTDSDFDTTKEMVCKWHVEERGWDDIGYHYLILGDGTLDPCRPERYVPSAQKGNNTGSIAIALVGRGAYRMEQIATLKALLLKLLKRYDLSKTDIWTHNEVSDKECPFFTARDLTYVLFEGPK